MTMKISNSSGNIRPSDAQAGNGSASKRLPTPQHPRITISGSGARLLPQR